MIDVYVEVLVALAIGGLLAAALGYVGGEREFCAWGLRVLFASPVWPLVLPVFLVFAAKTMFTYAFLDGER